MSKAPARERIIESAVDLFRKQGYEATGVDQIIAAAGVSKGSFYHAFKSKQELGLEVLEVYFMLRSAALREGEYKNIEDPLKRILAFVEHGANAAPEFYKNGCLMCSFSADLAATHPAFRQKLMTLFDLAEQGLMEAFEPLAEYLPSVGPTTQDLARQYVVALQGGIVQSQAYGDPERTRQSLLGFRHYLECLLSR